MSNTNGLLNYVQMYLNEAEADPLQRTGNEDRLANVGIPIGFAKEGISNRKKYNDAGLMVMPDGSIYKEANTFGNKPGSLKDVRDDVYMAYGSIPWNNMNNAEKERAWKQINHLSELTGIYTKSPKSGHPNTLGTYSQRENKIRVKKGLSNPKSVIDHEFNHAEEINTLGNMYRNKSRGNYDERLNEFNAFMFGSRQLPPKYTDPSSSDFIHPLIVFDNIDDKFVDVTDKYQHSLDLADPKKKIPVNDDYIKYMSSRTDELNNKLMKDDNFRDKMKKYYNGLPGQQAGKVINDNSDGLLSWISDMFK